MKLKNIINLKMKLIKILSIVAGIGSAIDAEESAVYKA
jgi:hypothetical protein